MSFLYNGEEETEGKQLIPTDGYGLPSYEKCRYIQIPLETQQKIEKLLRDEGVPYKIFEDAGHAFCESEAEFRLRGLFRGRDDDEEDEENELEIEQRAIDERESMGDFLHNILCKSGEILDNDHIDELIKEHFDDNDEELKGA
jgi:hypothetical protein